MKQAASTPNCQYVSCDIQTPYIAATRVFEKHFKISYKNSDI